ncbi:MAG: retroviral-like aspartic protease family protein [Rhizomicrobium sp.]
MGQRLAVAGILAGLIALPTVQAATPAELPYRIGADGRISTDVFVNGKGPFNFVLDTASSRTMLFEHLRKVLRINPSEGALLKVYAMNNIGTAVPVKPRDLTLDNLTISGLTLGVLPDEGAAPEGGESADGILGMDALSHYFLVMDHNTLQLKLLDPEDPAADVYRQWPSAELEPHHAEDTDITFWWVRARFGRQPVTALLDTGSGITMLNWDAAERLGLNRAKFEQAPVPEELRDALGTIEPVVRLAGITIALDGHSFPHQTAIIANARVFNYFGLQNRPAAIIGPALLRYNSLAIDFGKRRLYIGPGTPAAHS